MRKKLLFFAHCLVSVGMMAQVAINTDNPDPSAVFEVASMNSATVAARLEATIDANGGISSITVLEGGEGYFGTPYISIFGDGTGAKATATVENGEITDVEVTNAGLNYSVVNAQAFVGSGAVTLPRVHLNDMYDGVAPIANPKDGLTVYNSYDTVDSLITDDSVFKGVYTWNPTSNPPEWIQNLTYEATPKTFFIRFVKPTDTSTINDTILRKPIAGGQEWLGETDVIDGNFEVDYGGKLLNVEIIYDPYRKAYGLLLSPGSYLLQIVLQLEALPCSEPRCYSIENSDYYNMGVLTDFYALKYDPKTEEIDQSASGCIAIALSGCRDRKEAATLSKTEERFQYEQVYSLILPKDRVNTATKYFVPIRVGRSTTSTYYDPVLLNRNNSYIKILKYN